MAAGNSILKLKVDSTEYDANIKKAAEGIQHLAKRMHDAQGDFEGLDKAELDFIKDLQYMTTVSKTASGQYRELENAYKNLAATYEGLSAFEKQGDAGKALAEQLEILKKRTLDMKANMDAASQSLQTNATAGQEDSSALSKLADKFVVNVDALKLFNWGLQAADGALKVAKDAFFASEANVDEWGRTIQSAQSVYEGFLISINNGDISGFLSRMDEIVQAARAAYNELDTLGTMKTIQAPKISAQQTENERIRNMIQTGRYIAPIDGRKNAVFNGREMQNGDKLTAGQIRALEKQLQGGMQNVVKLVGNEVKQTGKAINAYYDSIAKQNGMSIQEFKKGTSSWEEFDKKIKGYEEYRKWDAQARTEFAKQGGRGNVNFDKNNPFAEFKKWGTFRVDKMGENSYNDLVRLIQQRDQQAGQAYSMQSQAYRTMNRAEGFTVSKLMGNSGSGSKSDKHDIQFANDSIMAQEKLVQDLTQKWKTASGEMRNGYLAQLEEAKMKLDVLQGKLPKDTVVDITVNADTADALQKIGNIEGVTINPKTLTVTADTTEALQRVQKLLAEMSGTIIEMKVVPVITDEDIERSLREQYGKPIEVPVVPKTAAEALEQDVRIKLAEQNMEADMQTMRTLLETQIKNGIEGVNIPSDVLIDQITGEGMDIPDEYWQNLQDQINEKLTELDLEPIKLDFQTGNIKKESKAMEKQWQGAAQAINAVGNAMEQIEDPAAKVVGTVAQAIATVALGYAQATAQAANMGPWAWIAFAASGLATMISTVSAIHSATGYANGGIVDGRGGGFVGGTAYSGDNVGNVRLDSGELVLNHAQQNNLANQLEGGTDFQNLNLTATIKGEQIRLALNNNGRRTGRGEYVQSRNIR